jgi:hypothetical protein
MRRPARLIEQLRHRGIQDRRLLDVRDVSGLFDLE